MENFETQINDLYNDCKFLYHAVRDNRECFSKTSNTHKNQSTFIIILVEATKMLEGCKFIEATTKQLRNFFKKLAVVGNVENLICISEKSKHYENWSTHKQKFLDSWNNLKKFEKDCLKITENENI